jgi:hypothetical protein
MPKLLPQFLGLSNPKEDACHLRQPLFPLDIFQFYFLVQGAHLLVLTRIKEPPISNRLNTILQEKEYFCPDPPLDFSGRHSCFRTLRHMTNDPHQEQMGAGFLSLQVKIPAFLLEGRRNPQEGSMENAKGHSDTVGTVYSTWQNRLLWSPH